MLGDVTKATYSTTREGVVYLMQEIHCALIEGLEIRNGEPGFDLRLTVL